MKSQIIIFTLLLSITIGKLASQEVITLFECYTEAEKAYPTYANKDLLAQSSELQIKNINSAYLPKISLNGQATYQSDVTKVEIPFDQFMQEIFAQFPVQIDIDIPELDIPSPKKDQYKATLDVNQVIYDGGVNKYKKEIEQANLETNVQQLEVELYQIKERINKLYFAMLLLQENKKALQLMIEEIDKRLKVMQSAVDNGVMLQSNMDILLAERLKLEQKILQIEMGYEAAVKGMGILLNKELSSEVKVELPSIEVANTDLARPESKLFDLQMNKLDVASKLVNRKNYPMLFGFGQAGYGRPGFNMFSDQFDAFYFVGAKLSWNLWDWKQSSREKQIYALQKEIIQKNKEAFEKNINLGLSAEETKFQKYDEILAKDAEIIKLRTKISETSASKLENGIITSTDYVSDLNAEVNAKISLKTHEIELIQAKINYLTIKGN